MRSYVVTGLLVILLVFCVVLFVVFCLLACLFASWLVGRSFFVSAYVLLCQCAFGVRVCLRAFACCVCVLCVRVFSFCVWRVRLVCVVCPCVCACGWLGGLIVFFVASALRVPPAETRLTVYRRLEMFAALEARLVLPSGLRLLPRLLFPDISFRRG